MYSRSVTFCLDFWIRDITGPNLFEIEAGPAMTFYLNWMILMWLVCGFNHMLYSTWSIWITAWDISWSLTLSFRKWSSSNSDSFSVSRRSRQGVVSAHAWYWSVNKTVKQFNYCTRNFLVVYFLVSMMRMYDLTSLDLFLCVFFFLKEEIQQRINDFHSDLYKIIMENFGRKVRMCQ